MIGVRKDSRVIRLLMAAALVLFVAACSSSDSGLKNERDEARQQVEDLTGQLDLANASIEDLRTQLANATDPSVVEQLRARIKELEDAEAARVAEEKAKEMAAAARKLFAGLAPGSNPNPPVSSGDSAVTTKFNPDPTIAATHGKAAKVTPDTVILNNKLAGATGEMSSAMAPWSSTMVSAKDTAGTKDTDTVVVYTDIAPDKTKPFEDVFTLTNNVLPQSAMDTKYIAAPMFPSSPGVVIHGENSAQFNEEISFPGTYAGAPGYYRCTEGGSSNDCESQATNNGIQLSSSWLFDPDGGAMAREADDEFSFFGWWLRVDANEDYSVDVFHGNVGGTAITDADFNALTGTATYMGPAAGKFAINPQLPGTTPMGGHFTATATLEADFEDGTGADPAGSISGTIHDFMHDGTALPWTVTFSDDAIVTTDAQHVSGDDVAWTIDGEKSSSTGQWSGNFRNQGSNDVPTTITGEFATTYNSEVGRIEGAFGATVQE